MLTLSPDDFVTLLRAVFLCGVAASLGLMWIWALYRACDELIEEKYEELRWDLL